MKKTSLHSFLKTLLCNIFFWVIMISLFACSTNNDRSSQTNKYKNDTCDALVSIHKDSINELNSIEMFSLYAEYFNFDLHNPSKDIERWKINLLYENIDSSNVVEFFSNHAFIAFKFPQKEIAYETMINIKKRALYVQNETPQKYIGQIGTFYKGGGSYYQYGDIIIYHFLLCSSSKEALEHDQKIWNYLREHGFIGKYIRFECSYKNLIIKE